MKLNKTVQVGDKTIGEGHPVFVVVELGVCHEQNIDVAKHFIDIAKKNGADAVKVEAFRADSFVSDKTIMHTYGTAEGIVEENYYQLLKKLELSFDQIAEIKTYADEKEILFFSTVHDQEDVEFFEEIDVCAYKIASLDMLHSPLIKHLCSKGKPVFMDTGGAYVEEIAKSLKMFKDEGFENLVLMHNPIGYPAPSDKTDLRMIPSMQKMFKIPVGLSCHTPGLDMVVASVAIGTNVIEKPITRNKKLKSPEHVFSFEDDEAKDFMYKVRNTEICMGNAVRTDIDEKSHARAKRRGIYIKSDLQKGHLLTSNDLMYLVPNTGISSEYFQNVLNKKLLKAYVKGEALQEQDLNE